MSRKHKGSFTDSNDFEDKEEFERAFDEEIDDDVDDESDKDFDEEIDEESESWEDDDDWFKDKDN